MGVMEHFLLLVPGPLPGCIFMRHIILVLFTVRRAQHQADLPQLSASPYSPYLPYLAGSNAAYAPYVANPYASYPYLANPYLASPYTVKRARIICLMKMHPGSGPGTSSRKCSMTPIYFA